MWVKGCAVFSDYFSQISRWGLAAKSFSKVSNSDLVRTRSEFCGCKKMIFTLGRLLVKRFFWRLKEKYIIRDFHPLVFFYALGLSLGGFSFLFFLRVFYVWFASGYIPTINAFAAFSSFIASAQFTLFAMWFDMEANKHLRSDDE